jgi:uncharacterized membrane protein
LRVELVAGTGQLFLLIGVLLLLYLDERRAVLQVVGLFAGSNLVLSAATLRLGTQYRGFGYLAATLGAAALALGLARRAFDQLEYRTFMLQPS